jgi:DNA-binding NarL/FixJ family response regulator
MSAMAEIPESTGTTEIAESPTITESPKTAESPKHAESCDATETVALAPSLAPTIDVLLCDDHTIVLAGLERLVSTFPGIRVVATVEGGAGAAEAVLKHRPHIVLMDLQMPIVDGIEATRQIMAAAPSTCVVVLTSFSDRHRIQGALGAGAVGYQLKDATPSELESAIRAAARGEAPLAPKVAMTLVRAEATPEIELSPRELETLALVAKGMPNKQIGRKLDITEATVKAHLTSIFRRIGVENRTQAARWFERSQGSEP